MATTLCRCTVHRAVVLGAPIGGPRRCPQTTKALRPHVVLLVDSSMIRYLTESGRNVSLLKRMARSASSVCTWNWSEMCWTWSRASCSNTALKATGGASVPLQDRQPVLRVEQVAYCVRHAPFEAGLGLRKRGEQQHPRRRFGEGLVPRESGKRWCAQSCEARL